MSASQVCHPRKRQHSLDDSTEPQSKRLKHCGDPSLSAPPVHYLDTLSKIWLTKEALREFNRRTNQVKSTHRHRPEGRRPLTRGFHAEFRSRLCSARTPASDFVQCCTPGTLKELGLFAKHGGPDLVDLRGYPEPAQPSRYTMSSAQSSRKRKRSKRGSVLTSQTLATATDTTATKVTKSSGSRDPNFRQRLNDNGLYQDGYEYPDGRALPKPEDWGSVEHMLAKYRASLSPSVYPEEKFREFKRADDQVTVEADTRERMISQLQGATQPTTRIGREILFNNIANMLPREAGAGGDKKGPVGGRQFRPDYYGGAHPDQLNFEIRSELGQYILPSTDGTRPMLPNFFIEAKGPKGSYAEVLNQACMDGAIGARAMHQVQAYGEKSDSYDNKTKAISALYKDGTLKMYAHHLGQPNGAGTDPEYYMNQLGAYAMTHNRDSLAQGMMAFRNAADWTEGQRNALIADANAV